MNSDTEKKRVGVEICENNKLSFFIIFFSDYFSAFLLVLIPNNV